MAFVASSIEEREDWCNKIINAVEKVKAVEVSFKKRKKRDTKPWGTDRFISENNDFSVHASCINAFL